jgi:hypothetical protein
VLTSEGVLADYSKQHQLRSLVDKIPDNNLIKPHLRLTEGLTRYATSHRYPNTYDTINKPPDASEFADFSQKVETVLAQTVAHFGVDLAHKTSPATNKTPIR